MSLASELKVLFVTSRYSNPMGNEVSGASVPGVRICQYNVLADSYTSHSHTPYCKKEALKWGYRRDLLKKEFKEIDADIFTLQEVEDEEWFMDTFKELGYDGFITLREGRADVRNNMYV